MQCPIDQTELRLAERHGVEIDYCPRCRGVWLDRGQLDKILEREAADLATDRVRRAAVPGFGPQRAYDHRDHDRDDDHAWDEHRGRRRRRGGWLSDVFEFGD
jgi:Zn-finger nucleic acid-binding protein